MGAGTVGVGVGVDVSEGACDVERVGVAGGIEGRTQELDTSHQSPQGKGDRRIVALILFLR